MSTAHFLHHPLLRLHDLDELEKDAERLDHVVNHLLESLSVFDHVPKSVQMSREDAFGLILGQGEKSIVGIVGVTLLIPSPPYR
jgi:hypothetical protein